MLARDQLKETIVTSFASQPEVFDIYFFGSEAEGCVDEYSDFDIIVCSNNLKQTQSHYRDVLSRISPIIGTLLLESRENHFAEMITLKSVSPYQKIDIHFLDDIKIKRDSGPLRNVFRKHAEEKRSISKLSLIPERKDVTWILHDILFSVPRFTKCLFRADFDMYRRWQGIVKNIWRLLQEKHFGWHEIRDAQDLLPQPAKHLRGLLSNDDSARLSAFLPVTGVINISASFLKGVDMFVSLSKEKADHFNVTINTEFVDYMTSFLQAEIDRYNSKQRNPVLVGKGRLS